MEHRAKRKTAEAVAAASAARKARWEAEQAKERRRLEAEAAERRKKEKAEEESRAANAFNLYEDLPAPDPEKDARAALIAEAASKAADVPKLVYVEDRSKVLFLDIDGVLRPLYGNMFQISSIMMDGENVPVVDGDTEFMPSAMSALRRILEETGASLVLSSEWRRHSTLREGVNQNLKRKGLPTVLDDTPTHIPRELSGNPLRSFAVRRAREIGAWLRDHPQVRHWVALDDIDLGQADNERADGQPALTPRLVLTDKTICLTKEDAKDAVGILKGRLRKTMSVEEISDY